MPIKADQLIFTSCRRGVRGGKGFQTRALTEGIRPEEQREIESRGCYSVPRNLPATPSEEEIASDYPVAFRYYKLGTGRRCFTRTRYTGKDYSQRWGNFVAHSLIVAGLPAGVWPIDYYEWPGWMERLSPEEDTEEDPPPLGTVDFDVIQPSPSFSLAELQTFLNEAPGRVETLASMVRAVFFGPAKSRMLVVRDTPLNGAFWLASVQKAFPPQQAVSVSLSTFQFDGRDCAVVNATTLGTDFLFDDTQRRFQFLMFDLLEGRSSEIPEENAEYAATVARWMAESPDRLAAFYGFMADVNHSLIDADLVKALRLFRLACGDVVSPETDRLAEAVVFARRHIEVARRAAILPVVSSGAEDAAAAGQAEHLRGLLGFLGESASSLDPPERPGIARVWLACFKQVRERRHVGLISAISDSRRVLGKGWPDVEREIADRLLLESELREVGCWLRDLPAAGCGVWIEAVLREALDAARTLGASPAWAGQDVRGLIDDACVSGRKLRSNAGSVLRSLGGDAQALAVACERLVYGGPGDPDEEEKTRRGDVAGGALADVLAGEPDSLRAQTRRALDTLGGFPVLLGEWRALVRSRKSLRALYKDYGTLLAPDTPNFDRQHHSDVAFELASALDEQEKPRQASDWLVSGEVERFGRDLRRWCITAAAGAIPLTREDPEVARLVEVLRARARAEGVKLDLFRIDLLESLEQVRAPNISIPALKLPGLQPLLGRLPAHDYGLFVRGFIRPALRLSRSDAEHGQILRYTLVEAHRALHAEAYLSALRTEGTMAVTGPALEAALGYWLRRDPGEPAVAGDALSGLKPHALEGISRRLVAMDRAEFEALAGRLDAAFGTPPAIAAAWKRLRAEVGDEGGTVMDRLVRFLPKRRSR